MNYYNKTLTQLIYGIENKTFLIEDVIEDIINRCQALDKKLNVFEDVDYEHIKEESKKLDSLETKLTMPFKGIPIGVKDCYNTQRMHTRRGSEIYKDYTAGNDARIIRKVRDEGALVVGKTKMAEFSIHEPSDTLNPHNLEHTPGTSSSGSAVAVATGMVPLAFGTQTAASTSKPASYCGVYGFKPTFGVFPRTGVLKTCDTLDTLSILTRSIEDIEHSFENLRLRGLNHPYIHNNLDIAQKNEFNSKAKVAVLVDDSFEDNEVYAKEALLKLKDEMNQFDDFEVEVIKMPEFLENSRNIHKTIYNKSISYYFKEEYNLNKELLSPIITEIIEDGKTIDLEAYLEALEQQKTMTKEFNFWMKSNYDVLITLSSSCEAPKGLNYEIHPDTTLVWTLLGAPTLAVPKFSGPSGLPFGFQVIGAKYSDYNVINFVKKLKELNIIKDSEVIEL